MTDKAPLQVVDNHPVLSVIIQKDAEGGFGYQVILENGSGATTVDAFVTVIKCMDDWAADNPEDWQEVISKVR